MSMAIFHVEHCHLSADIFVDYSAFSGQMQNNWTGNQDIVPSNPAFSNRGHSMIMLV